MEFFKRKKVNYFFVQFAKEGELAKVAMKTLSDGIANLGTIDLLELKNQVHQIEHQADELQRETAERLAKEFMTPIDREDIYTLLNDIDDMIDAIDEVSYKMYLRNYTKLPDNTGDFIQLAIESVDTIKEILDNFPHLTDQKLMYPLIDKVTEIEEKTDHLLENNVHALYIQPDKYPRAVVREAEDVYSLFECITDKCRDVTKTIVTIMYKNL